MNKDRLWLFGVAIFLVFLGLNPIRDGWFGDGIFRGLDAWVETLWWNLVGTAGGVMLVYQLKK